MNSRLTVPRLSLTVLLIAAFTGCAGWRTVKGPPAEYIAKEKPDVVRLTLADTSWVLSRPTVQRDSVIGLAKGMHPRFWTGVPSADIRALAVHNSHSKAGGIAALSVGALFVTVMVVGSIMDMHRGIP